MKENEIYKVRGAFSFAKVIVLGVHDESGMLSYQAVHKTAEEGRTLPVMYISQQHFLARHVLKTATMFRRLVDFLTRFFS